MQLIHLVIGILSPSGIETTTTTTDELIHRQIAVHRLSLSFSIYRIELRSGMQMSSGHVYVNENSNQLMKPMHPNYPQNWIITCRRYSAFSAPSIRNSVDCVNCHCAIQYSENRQIIWNFLCWVRRLVIVCVQVCVRVTLTKRHDEFVVLHKSLLLLFTINVQQQQHQNIAESSDMHSIAHQKKGK